MSFKALLVNPPTGNYMRDDRCQAPVDSMTAQPARAPMDLLYMAATLEQLGGHCRIEDYPIENKTVNDFKKDLLEFFPDYLIISITTPTLEYDMQMCQLAKKISPSIITIAKGAHFKYKSKEILEKYSQLDFAIKGECEITVKDIFQIKDKKKILGITFRKNNKIIENLDRPPLENLDDLPLPARHLLKNELYIAPDTGKPIAYITTGRGCPHKCIYCAVSVVSGYKLRKRSVRSVILEIEECYFKYQIKDFFFRSDTFTWDEVWVVELCKKILEKNIKIRWGANSRVNTITEKRILWMKKSGCYVIGFGVESGNQDLLNKMKKGTTIKQARNAIALCKKYGIKSYTIFILGLPWETMQTAKQTIAFAKELDGDFADFTIAYPLPGTEYWEIAKSNNLFSGSLTGFDYGNPIVKSFNLSTKELIKIRKRAIYEFYVRPKFIVRTLKGIRSFTEAFRYLKYGVFLLMNLLKKSKGSA